MINHSPALTMTGRPQEQAVQPRHQPPYHVILENDDYHTFPFVIDVLVKVLHYDTPKATQLALAAHQAGRAVVWTGSKEVAELKVEQIRSIHELRESGRQVGPLSVLIEPAPG